ncbi:CBS domain-containing protein [Streptomyces erythrochromogenes]|uniref:CBS domain-containing protein n=1 Tax=Streptomyces erythrochromogenes TaxID=285574 RepID=UPI0036B3886F
MTLVQMQPRTAVADPGHRAADDAQETASPQVSDDMTVEVALSVMASARARHLRVCDDDGLCTGVVTPAQLAAVRDGGAYTDRVRLRDVLGDCAPATFPVTMTAGAGMRHRRLDALPVVDGQSSAPGVLALAR